jgi:hypothetical protein
MENIIYNEKIEGILHDSGIYEIKVHPFSLHDIGLYEGGIREALKNKNTARIVFFDFSEVENLQNLDDKALFDIFQFISFACLKNKDIYVNWEPIFLKYLVEYTHKEKTGWKLSSSTIVKLINANCNLKSLEEKIRSGDIFKG